MAEKPKIKFRLSKPRAAVLIAIALVIVLSAVALLAVETAIRNTRAETDALAAQAYAQEQTGSRLEQYIQELGTIRGILRIAQEELGLVQPDTVIFDTQTGN